jgi:DNA-binding HxlR family transcriptional regulator
LHHATIIAILRKSDESANTTITPMLKSNYQGQTCSIARSLEAIGERWSLLIVRSIFLDVHRFDALVKELGIARNVLTGRLQHLIDEGILERVPYQQRPVRYEYRATAKGEQLFPVVLHLMLWGDIYYREPTGAPRVVEHTGCGGQPDDHLGCDRCGEPLTLLNTNSFHGPGHRPGRTRAAARQ